MNIELFKSLIEKAKTDKRTMLSLKHLAVIAQQFELAANIRDLEKQCFPETEEEKAAKESSKKLATLFAMVDLNVSEDVCWLLNETLTEYRKKKGKFSLEDAARLKVKKSQIFPKVD